MLETEAHRYENRLYSTPGPYQRERGTAMCRSLTSEAPPSADPAAREGRALLAALSNTRELRIREAEGDLSDEASHLGERQAAHNGDDS